MKLILEEHLSLLIVFLVALILAIVLFSLSYVVAKQVPDAEKISAYECGFDPFEDARNTFDVRFYLVAILFIIFDLEAAFLYPWAVSLGNITSVGFWSMFDFITFGR